jgi:hypothetical protein
VARGAALTQHQGEGEQHPAGQQDQQRDADRAGEEVHHRGGQERDHAEDPNPATTSHGLGPEHQHQPARQQGDHARWQQP